MKKEEYKMQIEMLKGELDNAYQNMHDDRKMYVSDLMEVRHLVSLMLKQIGFDPEAVVDERQWEDME
tara:strand:+ start:3029 stop:3229 length:201 start_codon:yes stop_codon:yes gene_type:complete